ncbi:hypothetical protein [Amaricoccus sp.]|uniref:hypothetical protein n=1 Tax=Amaricoccus sp. TaxID=1872485 RepID=UPI002638CEA8|nr:hypothetical protein [uncultured Amaricoccus sp.]
MIANILNSVRYERVLKLLDQERKVILNGPLAELPALVDRREVAMAEILESEDVLPEAFLTALKAKAERNSRLLLASLAGVRSAGEEISRISAAHDKLRTYAPNGHPIEVRQPTVTRDKRA